MPWIRDPKTKEESVTLTLFVLGVLVSALKLLTSGLVIGTVTLGVFSGGDFAAAVGALGTVYTLRKYTDSLTPPPKE